MYPKARERHLRPSFIDQALSSDELPCERACRQIASWVVASAPHCWLQGRWSPPLTRETAKAHGEFFSTHRLKGVGREPARALVEWSLGNRRVCLLETIPRPHDVLRLQAVGARCVSLLCPGQPTAPHADALAFALHDLCHLEKFVDPDHHLGQVGFFRQMTSLLDHPAFGGWEASFDEAWRADRDHVFCDMNGSAIFLFAALKMKLKMAVRRRRAGRLGIPPPEQGTLDSEEEEEFEKAFEELLDLLGFDSLLRECARTTRARGGDALHARRLLGHFEEVGTALTFQGAGCIAVPP